MREIQEPNPFAFLDRWVTESTVSFCYDERIGQLGKDIIKVVKEEVGYIPSITYEQEMSNASEGAVNDYRWDIIELEVEGEVYIGHIYRTPTIATLTWETNGIFHKGFNITTGNIVVIVKGEKGWA
ncbi:hypothetical protein [Pontibacter indicus]|nr:hypothetical protein [Pontibacter indicus]